MLVKPGQERRAWAQVTSAPAQLAQTPFLNGVAAFGTSTAWAVGYYYADAKACAQITPTRRAGRLEDVHLPIRWRRPAGLWQVRSSPGRSPARARFAGSCSRQEPRLLGAVRR